MIDHKINKTEILAEETEKRVRVLEVKTKDAERTKTIEEKQTVKVKNGTTLYRYIDFYCNEQTGLVLDMSVESLPETEVLFRVYLNGKQIVQYPKGTSINEKLNFLASAGKNQIKILAKFTIADQKPTANFCFKLTGDFTCNDTLCFFEPLEQNFVVCHSADSISFYDTENFEIQHSFMGSKNYTCAILKNGDFAVLIRKFEDVNRLFLYRKDDFSQLAQINVPEKFSTGAVRKLGDLYSLYLLKGNYVFELVYSDKSTYSQTKLPIKAKNISVFSGKTKDYFCYEDLFGNFVVSAIKKDVPFEEINTYTFGKIKNPKVYEVDTTCYLSYKCGQLVVERELETNSNLTILGAGDEGLRLPNGKIVIRQNQAIELI